MRELSEDVLRRSIAKALRKQGYHIRKGKITLPLIEDKDDLRQLHSMAVAKKLAAAEPQLRRHESRLLQLLANGSEMKTDSITPKLVCVAQGSQEELLFRYVCLHWSIPVSSGYGRRMRFLVMDESNSKLIGLVGLGDPVFAVSARDDYIGWSNEAKKERLYHIMDAYVLGSVPPYSSLLGGKLVALMTLAKEVREVFRAKYAGTESLIQRTSRKPYLALITTTSALGRSSVYNRIRVDGFTYWKSVGFTRGSGDFHFSNGVYTDIRNFVVENCEPTAKHPMWGKGFRNKREVVRKCLSALGLSSDLAYHGVQREIFVAPLGRDALRFLRGEVSRPCFYEWSAADLAEMWKQRWLVERANRVKEYQSVTREDYRLWR